MSKPERGSKKHILDLLNAKPDGVKYLNKFLEQWGANITDNDKQQPNKGDPKEVLLPTFCQDTEIGEWWVEGRGKKPTWDLLSTFNFGGRKEKGILLVEAKAHEKEFEWKGKKLSPTANVEQENNHKTIKKHLNEANQALNKLRYGSFGLSVSSHYQLSNRVAHLWKLSTYGMPVILLYLGFTGDKSINPSYFRDDEHWQRALGGYLQGVIPHLFLNEWHTIKNKKGSPEEANSGRILMISKSISVSLESK